MYLQHLSLRNFRNYEGAHASFGPGINLIQGENAQGKTNLLEAIYFLSTGKSFRTASLTDLIRHGEAFFYIEAQFIRDGLPQTLKVYFDGKQKKIHYNSTAYPNFSNLLGLLPSVLFAPEDVSLVTGSPAERRRFINLHIAQIDPLYVHHLVRYAGAMRQRNQMLKQQSESAIHVWEEMMAVSASYLVAKREEALLDLKGPLNAHMNVLSRGADTLAMDYGPSFSKQGDLPAAFIQQFQKQRKKEMQIGSTLSGPHRDDLVIKIGEKDAKLFSSEGQKRSCISAVRLAEWERLKIQVGACPLMCIDDFGAHLDTSRHSLFQTKLASLKQVFLTSPHALSLETHTLSIKAGTIN